LQQQQAHIFALQEQRRLEAEQRANEERDRRRREREDEAKRKAEKKKLRAIEEEKRRNSAKEAALLAERERQKASEAELRQKQEELERQMRLMRQRSGLEWFRNFYTLACKAQGLKENDALMYTLQRAIKKNRSIYELDLFKVGLDARGVSAITTAFRDTFDEIDKMTPDLELVNTIDPPVINLRGNNIRGGIAIVDLCLAIGEVTVLDVSANNLGPKFAGELAEALFNYKNLKTFRAGANNMGPAAANALLKSLHHQKSLEVLDLGENGLTDKCAPALAELIQLQPLKALTIQYNKFKESGMKVIIKAIASCSSLVELDVTQTGMDKRVKDLMEILERRTSMRFIALGFNKLGSSFPKMWSNFLANQHGLEEVDLRYASLGSRGMRTCIEAIQVHASGTITELTLNGNILDKKCLQVVLDLCHDSKTLKRLALRACGIKSDMMVNFANAVQGNNYLEVLDVAGNSLKGKDAISAFEQCIRLNTKLKAIGLAALKLDKKSIIPLARAVQFNAGLEKVHFGSNKLGDDGIRELAENIAGNENLQTLVIKDVNASARSVVHLVQHLSTRSRIEIIDATENDLPRTKAFVDQLMQYPQITVRV
jgi:Ran GTPase-activating protein (RanGAP) involved in mRNA processing and transport